MASTVLVKDVLWSAGVLLHDQSPQFQRWSENELVDWLNDGQVAITKFLPAACSRVDAVKLRPGTRQSIDSIAAADCKPGDGSTPAAAVIGTQLLSIVRNMGADGATPGRVIRQVAQDILDDIDPSWHTVIGPVVLSYCYDPETPRNFYVTPGVPSTGGPFWVEIKFTAQPIKILNTGVPGSERYGKAGTGAGAADTITIADEYRDDLVNYVVARANMKDTSWADGNKASAFSQLFVSSLNAKVAALTGSNPNLQRLPFAPEPLGQAK